jgi:predicted aspartyl protease
MISGRTTLAFGLFALLSLGAPGARSTEPVTIIPMTQKHTATYYVQGSISGYGKVELMVDTGAGYTTINEETLNALLAAGQAAYVKELTGVLADGTRKILPVYRLTRLVLGGRCVLHDVEAAVLPHRTRLILGLSALEKAAPFVFSTRPPRLSLSNCAAHEAHSDSETLARPRPTSRMAAQKT